MAVAEVKKTLGPIDVKSASVHVSRGIGSNPDGEFWGPAPEHEYFHVGSCHCAWEARAKGWEMYLACHKHDRRE